MIMHVGFVSKAEVAALFDYFVGSGDERWWHIKTERLSRPEIDGQIELRRLLDRQIGRLLTLEDFAHVYTHSPINGWKAGAIADQATFSGKSIKKIDRGYFAFCRLCDELQFMGTLQWIGTDDDGICTQINQGGKRGIDLVFGTRLNDG